MSPVEFYYPSEDSFLLAVCVKKICREILNKNKNANVLDIGTGSGIQALSALKAGILRKNILAVDINRKAVESARKKGLNAKVSNLFSAVTGKKFDLIIFNPPYLPADKFDKEKDTAGGKLGDETILRFLRGVRAHLNNNGKILIVLSSLTPEKRILAEIKKLKLKAEKISEKRIFFEEIYVFLIS